jgi:hypothetical protein
MRIDTTQTSALAAQLQSGGAASSSGAFQDALAQATSDTVGPALANNLSPVERQAVTQRADAATEAAFRDYVHKPPAQRIREQVLKEMHLSEEDLAKLPPKEREAMEKAITAKIKERMQAAAEAKATKATAKLLHRL